MMEMGDLIIYANHPGGTPILLGEEIFDRTQLEGIQEFGHDDLLVVDPECNYIVHQDDRWFSEQKRRVIASALVGMTGEGAALEIHESMMADFAPLCLSLGRDGVGPGLKAFWADNAGLIRDLLMQYEAVPQLLEEDAKVFGLL